RQECNGDAAQCQRATGIADDHYHLAVPTVDERASRQTEDEVGHCPQRPHESRLSRRAGQPQHEEWEGNQRHLCANRRDRLSAPEQHIVAIEQQWSQTGWRGGELTRHGRHTHHSLSFPAAFTCWCGAEALCGSLCRVTTAPVCIKEGETNIA